MLTNKQLNEVSQDIIKNLLEKYTNKKVVLVEGKTTHKLEEVKRKKMTKPYEVAKYVLVLLKKYNIREQVRVTMTGNVVKVENKEKKYDVMALKSVTAELIEEGFSYGSEKVIGEKTFVQLIDKKYRLIVLLPAFKKTVLKKPKE